jgi:long-chain acyl-CoA synthetase
MDGGTMSALQTYPTVMHMLRATATQWPEREAVVCGAARLTYRQYMSAIAAFAQELLGLGARGERVVLLMGNSVDICIATFAVHAAGAQVVPLNPLYTGRELRAILEDAGARIMLYDEALAPTVEPLIGLSGVATAIKIGGASGRSVFTQQAGASLPEPLPDPLQFATLQYTGGTTGRSKGVNLTHKTVATNIAQRESILPTGRDGERILCMMPLFHSYAVAMCLHNAANCGGTLVILPRFTPEGLFEIMRQERISILAGSPTVFTALVKHELFSPQHFRGLRMSYSGSAPLPEALLKRWEEASGAPALEGYGQSESGPVLTFNPLHGKRKPQSVGVPLPETTIEIVDAVDGETSLPPGQIGEIRARGPQVMYGYRNRPEETAQALRNGWLYTGDLGELDAEGYLYLRDRKKDMVLVSGFNVYPREVEEVLCLHPAILETAVIGVPDENRGGLVKAFVVLRPGQQVDTPTLDTYCRQNLAAYKVPRQYVFLGQLPKTVVGKIDKKQLA